MKKLFVLLFALVMVLSLAACGGDDEKPPASSENTESAKPSTPQPAPGSEPAESEPEESESAESESSDVEKSMAEKADALAVSFGTYNGQPISWRVLDIDVQNERALLITKDCLTELQFHAEAPEDLTYRVSDLRVWLVGDFHYSSFTDEEKERIIEVENPQDTNSETGAREPEGYETTDTVFILSASEMQQYFADDEDMAGFLNGEDISYWTRTPGNDTTGYVCTYTGGGLYMTGNQADSTGVAVRPAIWVDLSGEKIAAPEDDLAARANEIAASFGTYNGNPLAWEVLTVNQENEKALLLTEKCVDLVAFHESDGDFTWENSEIRAWLGSEFYENTFASAEKGMILETVNSNPANSETGVEGCGETTDFVFLLSEQEALTYFGTDEERLAETFGGDIFQWWLRTPGEADDWFMLINDSGGLYYPGSSSHSSYGVRPAVWVNLSKEADPAAQETFDSGASDAAGPAPEGWPENEHTRLVPTPAVGGKVLKADSIGTMFTIDLDWTMEQGTTYAGQLAEAGFGEDAAEKFAQQGYIDRTADGVNVQLLEIGGKVNVSIMETE